MCAGLTAPAACSDYVPAVLATGVGIQVVVCHLDSAISFDEERILGLRTHAAPEGPHRPSGDT